MKYLRVLVVAMIVVLAFTQINTVWAGQTQMRFRADAYRETKVNFENVELTIPAGSSMEELSVEQGDGSELRGMQLPFGFQPVGKPFTFGPHGMKFREGKGLHFRLKLDKGNLPEGIPQEQVKLFYINKENGQLEIVPSKVDSNNGTLEAELEHFSSYVPGISSGWDGNGLAPFMDYANNGEEHVRLYCPDVNVISRVSNLGGSDCSFNLDRMFSSTEINITNPFYINKHWAWAVPFCHGKVFFPGGAAYSINPQCSICGEEQCSCYRVEDHGEVFGFRFILGSNVVHFKDGTEISWTDMKSQTVRDCKGNWVCYYFTKILYSGNPLNGIYIYRVNSLVDSAGRNIIFKYNSDYSLQEVQQRLTDGSLKTLLSVSGGNFTNALGFVTSYSYKKIDNDDTKLRLEKVVYPNGIITKYEYSYYRFLDLVDIRTYYLSSQKSFMPNQTVPFKTVNYKYDYDEVHYSSETIVTNDFSKTIIYFSFGYKTREDIYDLSGKLLKRTNYQYEVDSITSTKDRRPEFITTQNGKADGTLGPSITIGYKYDRWGNIFTFTDPYNSKTYMAYSNSAYLLLPRLPPFSFIDQDYSYGRCDLSAYDSRFQDALYTSGFNPYKRDQLLSKATIVNDPIHGAQLRQTHYQYNSQGNVIKESVVYNGSYLNTTYTYDSYRNMLSKTDPNGNTLHFEYDPTYHSYLTRVYKPDNTIIATYAYDYNSCKPITVTDPNGNTFTYTYDRIGRMTSETLDNPDPKLGITRVLVYDDINNKVTIFYGNTQTGWQAGQILYHPLFGKPTLIQRKPVILNVPTSDATSLINALNASLVDWVTNKTITYDNNGRMATTADNLGHTTFNTYDALDRVIKTTYPDNTFSTATWDDRKVTKVDANGNKRVESYDKLDRLTSLQEFVDAVTAYTTSYQYDSASQLITTTNPKGAVTTNTYDNLGRLIRTDFPQDGANPLMPEIYTYDNVGNIKTKTNAKGVKTLDYEFFAGYRLKQVTEPEGRAVTNTYDNNDNLLTQQASNGITYTYNYNARNMATGLTAQMDGNTFNVGYDYDAFGRVTSIAYPNRLEAVGYNYDELDRLQSIPGFVTSCSYDGDSKITDMLFGNGINNHYDYRMKADNSSLDDKLAGISVGTLSSPGSLLNLNYFYDNVGNITRINTNNSTDDYYSYDGLNRLTWAGDNATPGIGNGMDWSYDSAGNMTNKQAYINSAGQGSIGFTYDLANRLWAMGSKTFTNDAAGNRIGKIDTDAWSYIYDGENRLTQVTKNGVDMLDNIYDGSGMRVKEVKGGQTTYYLYQGNNPLLEFTPNDGKYKYFIYAGSKRIAEEKDGVVSWYHSDHLGSTRVVTDSSGALVAEYKFKPYGETEASSGSFSTDYGFTGKPLNADVGLSYFGARFYDPEVGRFLTVDPGRQGLNWYAYCGNNPINRIDPDGRDYMLLNMTDAAFGYGHNACLVGNDKDGWSYYSKDGAKEGNARETYKTFEDFQNSKTSDKYDQAYRISTTKEQDAKMKAYGDKNYNKPYSVSEKTEKGVKKENCADLAAGVGKAGGVDISKPKESAPFVGSFTAPNEQYDQAKEDNEGTEVDPNN